MAGRPRPGKEALLAGTVLGEPGGQAGAPRSHGWAAGDEAQAERRLAHARGPLHWLPGWLAPLRSATLSAQTSPGH